MILRTTIVINITLIAIFLISYSVSADIWKRHVNSNHADQVIENGSDVWVRSNLGGVVYWNTSIQEYTRFYWTRGLPSNDIADMLYDEKIGLTLIGRMGEFASTLERVVMTVARIEKVENLTAETTYFLKNLQKAIDGFKRDYGKIVDKIDSVELDSRESYYFCPHQICNPQIQSLPKAFNSRKREFN